HHWLHTTLYAGARGLTSLPLPYGGVAFEIQFDFLDHRLDIVTAGGRRASVALAPQPVAEFYTRLMSALGSLGVHVSINTKPQELPNPIPFEQDWQHTSYDPEYAHRFWRILLSTATVLQ